MFHHEERINSEKSAESKVFGQRTKKREKMAGVSTTLSWQDVKEWVEKQGPYMLQTVLKTTTNLLATHVKKSAAEEAKPALPVGPVGPIMQYMLRFGPASEDSEDSEDSDVGQVVAEDIVVTTGIKPRS